MTRVGTLYRESITGHIKQGVEKNGNTFVVTYSGVSALQMSNLRKGLKRAGATFYVAKKSLAQRALFDLSHQSLADGIEGQTALVFSDCDSVPVSKVLVEFAKECEGVRVHGGVLDGRMLGREDIQRLSELPSREVLLVMLLGTIQSPLTRLAGALNGKTRELLYALKQLSEKKGGT